MSYTVGEKLQVIMKRKGVTVTELARLTHRDDILHNTILSKKWSCKEEGASLRSRYIWCCCSLIKGSDNLAKSLARLQEWDYVNKIDTLLREVLVKFKCINHSLKNPNYPQR